MALQSRVTAATWHVACAMVAAVGRIALLGSLPLLAPCALAEEAEDEHRARWKLLQANHIARTFTERQASFDVASEHELSLIVGPTSQVYRFHAGDGWEIDRLGSTGMGWAAIDWAGRLAAVPDDADRITLEYAGWRIDPDECPELAPAAEAVVAFVQQAGRTLADFDPRTSEWRPPPMTRITLDGPTYELRLRAPGAVVSLQAAEFLGTGGMDLLDDFAAAARACIDQDQPHWIRSEEYHFESFQRWRSRGQFPAWDGTG